MQAQPEVELSLPVRGKAGGGMKMKRRCELCGCLRNEEEFLSAICGWCDKIAQDVAMDQARGAL